MKIGLFLALYSDRTLEEALDAAVAAGCETVEIMSGSWSPHCRPGELLADPVARDRFATVVHERGLTISALSCHANPLHPDRGVAATATHAYRDTVRLAAELGVETVITFSGCPGESEHSLRPSWVTCSWPDEFPETLAWQWETRVLPYWAEAARFTRAHGVRIAIEPHPGFVVYNTASMLRLRETATDVIGVNFDPSHLFWQGMEPVACVRALGDAIFHVHAKDTGFHDELLAVNGVLEPIPGNRPAERSWIFRSVGVGHPVAFWRELVEALRASGYDGALSIEHEDPLLSQEEGLAVAVETLRAALDRGGDRVSTEVVVGLDVGTTGVKAVAVAPDGSIAAVAERGYPLSTPHAGWSEQDPEDWWTATRVVLAGVRAQIGAGSAIAGIGVSGQMHGLVALDSAGRVVRPAILWNDQRTAAECAEIEERIGLERLIALTGNRALPGFTAPKLLWLRRHEPDAYGRIARIMLPKDYVRLRLTGEWATDVADASGTLLLDVAQRSWSAEVLDALEIPSSWLPPVLESPEVSGNTLACDELSQGIPVAAGAGDCASAAVGVGIDRPGPLSIVMGTSGVVFAALPAFASDPEARVHAFCHAVPGQWHAMGVMLSAAGSLQWLHDRLAPGTPFADLVGEAGAWGPGVEGLLFAPYLAGERTPHADPSARAAFTGLELRHDRGALVRAVLEGVAFGLRDSLELVTTLGGPADRARASGGGARGLWLEIVASVLGVPIESTAVEEGSAYGAALLGGVAAGMFADVPDAVARCVRVLSTVEPNPAWRAAYDETYARFRALYPALDTVKERAE